LGNGERTSFWKDVWHDASTLKELFPHLFLLAVDKNVIVAESGCWSGLSWKWNLCLTLLDREEGEVSMLQCQCNARLNYLIILYNCGV